MKNSSTKRRPPIRSFCFCFIIFAALGCSGGPRELTRESARRLITESQQFKQPIAVNLKDDDDLPVQPRARDETAEQAQERALNTYFSSSLTIGVLSELGYVAVKPVLVKPAQLQGGPLEITPWFFKVEVTLTDKGRQLAKAQGLTDEKAVPLAHREIVEVTGIRTQGIAGAAEFTWQAVPTEAGKGFDPTTDVFKSLPPELQQVLTKSRGIGPFASSATIDWNVSHKAMANFQKYDDGWRLRGIRW
jgi:hypothetical protein